MRQLRRLLPLLLLLAIASCGGAGGGAGGGGDDPDPAKAMPADVGFYLEGTVRPEGQAKDAIETLTAKFGVDNPGEQIVDALEQAAKENDISYAEDVEPWLGRRVGLSAAKLTDMDPPFFGVIGVSDAEKAKAFVKETAEGESKTYEDTTYWLDDDTYTGVAGDYVVLSDDEQQFRRVVDQIASGEGSLADDDRYGDATGDLPDNRVGTFYLSIAPLIELAKRDPDIASSGAGPVIEKVYGNFESVAGGLTPYENRAVLEIQTKTKADADEDAASLFSGFGKAPALVKEAPADALGVYGIADLGPNYKRLLDEFAGALGGAALKGQLQSELGIDIDEDVFSWIGDTVVFVRGTSQNDLNGAVMIDATDEQTATSALPKLVGLAQQRGGIPLRSTDLDGADQAWEAQIPGVPQRAYVARAGGRVVLGYGEEATRMGLQPSSSLDANGGYDRAKQAVDGLDPFVILDAQKLVALAERYAGSDPSFAQAKPYLEPLAQIVSGSASDGDTQTTRIAVSVE